MELKAKFLKWSAGFPVTMLNNKTADQLGISVRDRISVRTISKKPREIFTIVDFIEGIIHDGEIGVSIELRKKFELKKSQKVEVSLAPMPKSLFLIRKKLDKHELSKEEIAWIIKDIVSNLLSESEIALFVSAMYKNGMTLNETVSLIKAILNSGKKLKIRGRFVADKHSIGGIPGDRTTPIVVSICAASGIIMPKSSSKAITSAAGTADVIETIAPVDFSIPDIKKIIRKTNACLVWSGELGIVPADSKIIQVENKLRIDPEAQLLASIMSKKLALGSKYILIDIPYGKTSKVNRTKALKLKKKFEKIGRIFNKKIRVVLTDGEKSTGMGIGPALELKEVIKILDPNQQGNKNLERKAIFLAGEILEMTGKTGKGMGARTAELILVSGKAFEKFKEIIKAQGGRLTNLPEAKFKKDLFAGKTMTISEINNKKINSLARILGCPLDKLAGIRLYALVNNKIKKQERLMTLYSSSESRLREAVKYYYEENPIR